MRIDIPDEIYESMGMEKPKFDEEDKPVYQRGTQADYLWEADKNFPKYVKIHGRDLNGELCACTSIHEQAFEESKWETRYANVAEFRILEGKHSREGRCIELSDFTVEELLDADDKLNKLYKDTMDSIHCEINTKIYPDIKAPEGLTGYELYCKKIEPIAEKKYTPEDVHTLEDAEAWVLKNHPEEYISMSAHNDIGDFSFSAIPQAYGEDGQAFSRKGREEITREWAKNRGMEIGTFDYTERDKLIAEKHDEIAKNLSEQGLFLNEPKSERVKSKAELEIMRNFSDDSENSISEEDDFSK